MASSRCRTASTLSFDTGQAGRAGGRPVVIEPDNDGAAVGETAALKEAWDKLAELAIDMYFSKQQMLGKIADFYEDEVQSMTEQLTQTHRPVSKMSVKPTGCPGAPSTSPANHRS